MSGVEEERSRVYSGVTSSEEGVSTVAVIGILTLAGVLFQVLVGFGVPSLEGVLLSTHVAVGFLGVVFALALLGTAWRRDSSLASRVLMVTFASLVAIQAWLGLSALGDSGSVGLHRVNGLLILVVAVAESFVTMKSAEERR